MSEEAFAVIRDALADKKMAGMARIVLYRRERPVVIEARDRGMLLTTLRFEKLVRKPNEIFGEIDKVKTDPEMIELASHIIDSKKSRFDPSKFEDKYEDALLDLIKAKKAGKKAPVSAPAPKPSNVINLFDALKKSLNADGKAAAAKSNGKSRKTKAPGRKPVARKRAFFRQIAASQISVDDGWPRAISRQARLPRDQRTARQEGRREGEIGRRHLRHSEA